MKKYTVRREGYADMTQWSDDPNFIMPIPGNNAGYRSEDVWFTQSGYEALELDIADKLEEQTIIDQERQELDFPTFEDIENGQTAAEQETAFRDAYETVVVDEVEKYVIPEVNHQEFRFPANYEIIVEEVIEPEVWLVGRQRRYATESDPLFFEADRESREGDDTKWNAYIVIIDDIKAEFPKPE